MSEATTPPTAGPVAVPSAPRLYWRAVVKSVGTTGTERQAGLLAWHLATCQAPTEPAVHCAQGQALLAMQADPDGHCLHEGTCARCGQLEV